MVKEYVNIQQVTHIKLRDREMWDYKLVTHSFVKFNWNRFQFERKEEKYWQREDDFFPHTVNDNGNVPEHFQRHDTYRAILSNGEERLFIKPRVAIYTVNNCFVKYFDTFDEAKEYVEYLLMKNKSLIPLTD